MVVASNEQEFLDQRCPYATRFDTRRAGVGYNPFVKHTLSRAGALAGYLKRQQLPMVVVSHDREFLDQLCTKIVETEHGVAASYPGNYTQFVAAKQSRLAAQWSAWEKQQKEVSRQVGHCMLTSGHEAGGGGGLDLLCCR